MSYSNWIKLGLPLGDPHALSCILQDNRNLRIYLYPLGFRDANQLFGLPEQAVQSILVGLTKILVGLTKRLSDSWV